MKNTLLTLLFLSTSLAFAMDKVPLDANDVNPILTGSDIPTFTAKTPGNKEVSFNTENIEKPIILTFYRGGWCPYCNKHLAELRETEEKLIEMGFEVVFMSPDSPANLQKSLDAMKDEEVNYKLLSDADMAISRAFGIAFKLDDATVKKYKDWGLDLEQASGFDHHQLPAPATFLVGTDGRIHFQYVNPDYKVRVGPKVLLAAAEDYQERASKKAKQ